MDFFWEKEGWEEADPHLLELKKQAFFRPFPPMPSKSGLYSIRGPRQIGKSSWLKLMLSHYVKLNQRCFYISCETIQDFRELHEILKMVRDREIIFLDEISFIKEWDRAVKTELDLKSFKMMILTGSNQVDLRQGIDRMPGRWGEGEELFLLPMNFSEFNDMRHMAGWPDLNFLENLKLFFKIGGFPRALAEAGSQGSVPHKAQATYRKWLLGDAVKLGKNEIYLKEILFQLALTLTTPISLQTLAKKTQIGSHHTVMDYIIFLEDFFALRTLYAIDPNTGSFRFRKNKKFYFTDPLLYWIGLDFGGISSPGNTEEKLAENVAAEALFRKYAKFGYFESKNGEVDFYAPKNWAIEIKWSEFPKNLSEAYYKIPVLKKIVWTQQNFLKEFPTI